ncbi:MAG: acyl-CoA dehydrogenase family protein [Proteobacteria bacterium]|nr:acyl-CoA dehydrogenase family protein [Pseudomonadota bacterium]
MNIELTEEQNLIHDAARIFAKEVVKPLAKKIDIEHYYPQELIPKLAENGFLGINVTSEYQGSGLDTVSYALIIEELSRACASTSVIVSAHNSLCIYPIQTFGSPAQKTEYLPKLASGKLMGCFALSEPGTGSDAARQTCISKKSGDKWIVNGVKNWITNAPIADICVLITMGNAELKHKGINCFIVNLKTTPGITIGKKEDKLGICGSPTASITFNDVELSPTQMLGQEGDGFKIAMKTLDGGRIGIAAQAVGIAQAALDDSLVYSKQRQTFGKFISQHQSIQNYLAEMSCQIDAARLLTIHAAKLKDNNLPYSKNAAQAKLFASEAAMFCTSKGIQIHGGYGYVKDFNVERYYRDAKITEIYEGTSEIQKLVIASSLLE